MENDSISTHNYDFQLIFEYFSNLERQGPGSPEVTIQALNCMSHLTDQSRIADIGCGTGGQTRVLAQNTGGQITGIDCFPGFIDLFNEKAAQADLQDRVKGHIGHMEELPFEKEELDLIWCEGAIYNIGFKRGLDEWCRFLKPEGCIAVSDLSWLTPQRPDEIHNFWMAVYPQIDTISNKVACMQEAGYVPMNQFVLPNHCWTDHFYAPQAAIQEAFLEKYAGNEAAEALVAQERYEKEMYDTYHPYYGYVFYIGKKI